MLKSPGVSFHIKLLILKHFIDHTDVFFIYLGLHITKKKAQNICVVAETLQMFRCCLTGLYLVAECHLWSHLQDDLQFLFKFWSSSMSYSVWTLLKIKKNLLLKCWICFNISRYVILIWSCMSKCYGNRFLFYMLTDLKSFHNRNTHESKARLHERLQAMIKQEFSGFRWSFCCGPRTFLCACQTEAVQLSSCWIWIHYEECSELQATEAFSRLSSQLQMYVKMRYELRAAQALIISYKSCKLSKHQT